MPNQKISELTTIVTVDNAVDLFPIVDTSANTTKKITPTALKSALALDNVNNTSDANKPVSTAQQDALNAKVTANAAIVAATKTKITYDAKGLVTAGDILDATDMPTGINAANIGTGVVSTTEFEYLNGVTSAIQTQIDSKQATLVSGTNIKTINSTSLLGAGDITIAGNPPSGVAGAIQFSNGSAFASDASNFFWDNTNKRLGVGTNAPSATGHIKGSGSTSATTSLLVQNSAGTTLMSIADNGNISFPSNSLTSFSGTVRNLSGPFESLSFQSGNSPFNFATASVFNITGTTPVVTSGQRDGFLGQFTFAPTSGTAILNVINASPTINQTGGANGITRGLYINPTLTAAADFRAIQTTAGKIIFGGLPTSSAGLVSGQIWNDAGTIKIV